MDTNFVIQSITTKIPDLARCAHLPLYKLKNRYIADHDKELCDKYYTGISHKASSTKRTFGFFSNWKHTPRVSGESKAICSRVQ
jgi:hypothetical protein